MYLFPFRHDFDAQNTFHVRFRKWNEKLSTVDLMLIRLHLSNRRLVVLRASIHTRVNCATDELEVKPSRSEQQSQRVEIKFGQHYFNRQKLGNPE